MQSSMALAKSGGALHLPGSLGSNARSLRAASSSCVSLYSPSRPRGIPSLRAVAGKESPVEKLSHAAAEAAKALEGLASKDVLQEKAEATAAQLRLRAKMLRRQALQASSSLNKIVGQTEKEREALLRFGENALSGAASNLRANAASASSKVTTLLQDAEKNKYKLLEVVQVAPEPIKELAETAVDAHSVEKAKKGAVIHDFCLGITFGGALVAGGTLWFMATGSINAIRFGFVLGGILLAAAIGSLKAWSAGLSSTPYILTQAAAAYLLFVRETLRFHQTRALFPTGIVALASIAMVAFYIYVVLAGGNPPSKKAANKSATAAN